MAEDWIKVEKVTPGKPEVLGIASELGIHPVHAFGLCVRFWMWCDDQLLTGNAPRVTAATLDCFLGHEGLASALLKVGWLQVRSDSLEVPHFDRHLSTGAKKRASTRERVAKSRAKKKRDERNECNTQSVTASLSLSPSLSDCKSVSDQASLFNDFDQESAFEIFWKTYPCKNGKKEAQKAWQNAVKRLATGSDVETAAEKLRLAAVDYAAYLDGQSNPPKVKYAQGWLNSERYEDDYPALLSEVRKRESGIGSGQVFDENELSTLEGF
ncbi:hypothetical protein [Roseiconus lacunae]|uniref:hypothetical protein n=1 Tax=Roseiconus lacunae TaxID=2605694 RepID=UPI001E45FBC6|nr:hypothetical protein [Roseiconus lacunae]MCD0460038.1 hypothetical protein [Roseiconus lacunae]